MCPCEKSNASEVLEIEVVISGSDVTLLNICIGNRMGPSKIKVYFHTCFQSFNL